MNYLSHKYLSCRTTNVSKLVVPVARQTRRSSGGNYTDTVSYSYMYLLYYTYLPSLSLSQHVPGSQYIVMESIVMLDSEDVLEKNEIVELVKVEANGHLRVRSTDGAEGVVPSSFVRKQLDVVGSMEGKWLTEFDVLFLRNFYKFAF